MGALRTVLGVLNYKGVKLGGWKEENYGKMEVFKSVHSFLFFIYPFLYLFFRSVKEKDHAGCYGNVGEGERIPGYSMR